MKRFLAIALLVTASAQANELADTWRDLGSDNQIVSGVKTAINATGTALAASAAFNAIHGLKASFSETASYLKLKDKFAHDLVIAGLLASAAYTGLWLTVDSANDTVASDE